MKNDCDYCEYYEHCLENPERQCTHIVKAAESIKRLNELIEKVSKQLEVAKLVSNNLSFLLKTTDSGMEIKEIFSTEINISDEYKDRFSSEQEEQAQGCTDKEE